MLALNDNKIHVSFEGSVCFDSGFFVLSQIWKVGMDQGLYLLGGWHVSKTFPKVYPQVQAYRNSNYHLWDPCYALENSHSIWYLHHNPAGLVELASPLYSWVTERLSNLDIVTQPESSWVKTEI